MGEVKLHLSTDLQETIAKLDTLGNSVKSVNEETEKYKDRAKDAYSKPVSDVKLLNTRIKEQEKLLKEVRQEELRLWAASEKGQVGAHKDWQRAKSDVQQYEKELNELKGRQQGLHAETSKGLAMFKNLGMAIAGAFTIGAIVNFSKESVAAYQGQIRSEAKLRTALKGHDDVIGRLIKQSNELQKVTLFADEDIINAQGLLAMYVKEEDQLKKLTPLILDFAQAKGMDLASAANLVGKSIGSSTNALTRYGIEVEGAVGSSERFNDVLNGLTKMVGGQAVDALTEEEKSLRAATVAMDEMKESWGKLTLSLTQTGLFSSLTETIDYLGWGLDKAQKSGGRFKDWWNWFWQTGDYGSEVFEMERNAEKNAEQLTANAKTLTQKTGGKTYGELVNDWIDADKISNSLPKEIKSLDALKAKLDELKKSQSAAPGPEAFHSFDADIKALEDEIALYEKKKDKVIKDKIDKREKIDKITMKPILKFDEDGMIQEVELFGKKVEIQFDKALGAMQIKTEGIAPLELKLRDEFKSLGEDYQKQVEKNIKFSEDNPLAAQLGFQSEEQLSQMKDYAGQIMDFVNQVIDQQVEAANRLVEEKQTQIDEQQSLVDKEYEDRKAGLANSYELEAGNLKNMQAQRDQAVKDREKMIQVQKNLAMIENGISLAVTIANIMKGFSEIPIVGWALGILAVGAMITGFIMANKKAKDATQMAEGGEVGFGLLKGRRHSQGGIPIEAEGGEWFFSRQKSQKYHPLFEAIQKDDREAMRMYFDRNFTAKFESRKELDYTKHLDEIARNTRGKKGETIYGPGFIIEKSGGYTKKIYIN